MKSAIKGVLFFIAFACIIPALKENPCLIFPVLFTIAGSLYNLLKPLSK